jgi:hypothetical protein
LTPPPLPAALDGFYGNALSPRGTSSIHAFERSEVKRRSSRSGGSRSEAWKSDRRPCAPLGPIEIVAVVVHDGEIE